MGRSPWTTPEQAEYLEGFVSNLDRNKQSGTLKGEYDRIAVEFLKKWPVGPADEDDEETDDALELQAMADERTADEDQEETGHTSKLQAMADERTAVGSGFISPL